MKEAGLTEVAFEHVALGMTGGTPLMRSLVWEVLQDYVDEDHFQFEHDSVTAWAGGTGGKPGVVVIGGTGSVALAVDSRATALELAVGVTLWETKVAPTRSP